jgi:hypothetical protein
VADQHLLIHGRRRELVAAAVGDVQPKLNITARRVDDRRPPLPCSRSVTTSGLGECL